MQSPLILRAAALAAALLISGSWTYKGGNNVTLMWGLRSGN